MLQPAHFTVNRDNSTRSKYGQAATILGVKFIPRVLETYGNMGSAFSSFLGKLSMELFSRQNNSDPEVQNHFKSRQLWNSKISVCLQRASARLIISKISRSQQANQRWAPSIGVDFTGASNWSIYSSSSTRHSCCIG